MQLNTTTVCIHSWTLFTFLRLVFSAAAIAAAIAAAQTT